MRGDTTLARAAAAGIAMLAALSAGAAPSVYPTGTTIYDPERTWSGYTIFIAPEDLGAVLIDMNGRTVKQWTGYHGGAGGPVRVLPGGYALGPGPTRAPHQESNALIEQSFDGRVVWQFSQTQRIEPPNGASFWSARQHHDWQREGLPGGYYSPGADPVVEGGKTLVLTHTSHVVPSISPNVLEDDRLIEVSADGKILWEWLASDHVDELGLSDAARALLREPRDLGDPTRGFDWLHTNSATYVGPNRWYDAGDERFAPDNVLISSRYANVIAIVDRDGSIVWRLGPDYTDTAAERAIGQVLGQHNPHIIPKGLPGAGNLLIFDNGANTGYGVTNVRAPMATGSIERASTRVLEIDPQTLEVVWSYSMPGRESFKFFSQYIGSAQRLANGNTMITEGNDGRMFEVVPDGEIVWEFVSPYFAEREAPSNAVYRAYRLPYAWVPQLARPEERAVTPPRLGDFRLPPD
jgi:Arylsulfotransferase (ASST)